MAELERIDHVHVYCRDREVSAAWYARVMGLERVPEFADWATGGGPVFLANSERTVALALFPRGQQPNTTTVAFRISGKEFNQWPARLRALGIPYELSDHGKAWSVYFNDPDGLQIELTSYEVKNIKT